MTTVRIPAGRNQLAVLFAGVGVEVGVERGKFSAEIAKYADELYCVDPWKTEAGYRDHVSQEQLDSFFEETRQRVPTAELLRKTSQEALEDFEDNSLDFVYIDGKHDYESVWSDINGWVDKVRPGGILAGHDFVNRKDFGVIEAVTYFFEDNTLLLWDRDRSPSWMVVK